MAHALTLSATSTGRAPVPTGEGPTLLVDDANAVMIVVSPDPSSWVPENVTLYRGGAQVDTPPMSDGTSWVLMGDHRFGTFHARATAAGVVVESATVRVVPATVSLRPSPRSAAAPQPAAPAAGAPHAPAPAAAAARAADLATAHPVTAGDPGSADPGAVDPGPVGRVPMGEPSPSDQVASGGPGAVDSPLPGVSQAHLDEVDRWFNAGPAEEGSPDPATTAGSGGSPASRPIDPVGVPPITEPESMLLESAPEPDTRAATPPVDTHAGAPLPAPLPATSTPTTRPQGVLEVPCLEYDGRFAAVVAAIFSIIAFTVLVIVGAQVIGDLIVAIPIEADTPTPDADAAARAGRATSALLIAVGSILVLAAAALAALDMRGRQRRVADTPTALRGTQITLDKAPGILENPGRFRSTLALLVTGVVVLLIGFVGQVHWS
jgi:hypothetical protein